MKRSTVLAAALLACVVTLGACRSSGSDTGGHKASIKVMQINLPPVNNQDQQAGVKAAIAAINAAGGISGHKLQYEFCSTGAAPVGDPNTTANCAAKAVQDNVAAMVGSFMVFADQVYPVIKRNDIANIQPLGAINSDNTDKLSFSMGNGYAVLAGQGLALAKAGCAKSAIITRAGLATDKEITESFAAGVRLGNGQVGKAILAPLNTLDFNSSVAQLVSQGVDCIGDGYPTTAETQPILQAVKSTGGKIKHVAVNVSVLSQDALKGLGSLAEGVLGADSAYVNAPASYTDTAEMTAQEKQMVADIKKYAPTGLSENHQVWGGYATVKIFQAAARSVLGAGKKVTATNVTDALQTLKVSTGIYPPLDFSQPGPSPKEPRLFNKQVNIFVVKGGQLMALTRESHDLGDVLGNI